jgi:Leucine-rich repeat (LRR) protein
MNKLTTLPESITSLTNLEKINVKQNASLKLSPAVKSFIEDKKI